MADGLENSRHPPFHSCCSLDVKITSLSPPLLHVMDGRTSRADVSPLPWHLSYHTTYAAANGVLPFGKVHSGITSRPERRNRCLSLYLAVISVSLVGETRAGGRVSTADTQMKLFKWNHCHICERGSRLLGVSDSKCRSPFHGILNGIFALLRVTMGSACYS